MGSTVDTKQIIYSMSEVGRVYPPKRTALKDISLGFYYGAKIGVIGENGSGKSTLLRIMADLDTEHTGQISRSKGYAVGLLEQEPKLDPAKTVKEIVEEGVAPIKAILGEFDDVSTAPRRRALWRRHGEAPQQAGNLQEKDRGRGRLGARQPA